MNTLGRVFVLFRDAMPWTRKRRNESVDRILAQLLRCTRADRVGSLRRLLEFSQRSVAYYRDVARDLPVDDLQRWPVLTKEVLHERFGDLRSDDHAERDCTEGSTGGSTGEPVRFLHDAHMRAFSEATREFHRRRCMGYDEEKSVLFLWGSAQDLAGCDLGGKGLEHRMLQLFSLQRTYLDASSATPAEIDEFIRVVNRVRPEVIHAYATALFALARRAERQGIAMHKPKLVYTTAEALRPFMRETVERVFRQHVFDVYGSREVGPIAGDGGDGRLHVFDFINRIEVVDQEGRQVRPGEEGRVLVTCLQNYAFPLIRYQIGDLAVAGSESDRCGLPLPTLAEVTGRITEAFVRPDGEPVAGNRFSRLLYDQDWVVECQATQVSPSNVVIQFVSGVDPGRAILAAVESRIREELDESCVVEWQRVERVPRTMHGKLLLTRRLS